MRFKELKSVRGFLTAVTLVAVCGSACAADADYVILEKSGDSSGNAWEADKLIYTEGVNYHWSDGLAPTNSAKDYLVKCCLASFEGEFKGGSLTLAEKAYLRPKDSKECKIADLRTEGGSAIDSQLAAWRPRFSGCLTLLDSTGTKPFSIIGGKNGHSTYISMDIKGGENTVMETGACKYMNADGSSQHVGGPMATVLSGRNDEFLGTVRVITNMVLKCRPACRTRRSKWRLPMPC